MNWQRIRRGMRRRLSAWLGLGESDPFILSLFTLSPEERRYLTSPCDIRSPLPAGAVDELRDTNPRLQRLRETHAGAGHPAVTHSRWRSDFVRSRLNLLYFRGESPIVWHYRELPRATRLKFFIYLNYLRERDPRRLLQTLEEDGAFGCWTFEYPGYRRVSRDLLDSVNELNFLDRRFGLYERQGLRVLDIGAGYGRLAHRMIAAVPGLADYCCVDAVPESSFLCEYYLRYRGCTPPARVVTLHRVATELQPGSFDLAINIHSFSECTLQSVEWWIGQLQRLRVRHLLIVPNDPTDLLTTEVDKTRKDFLPALEGAGYQLVHREPCFDDAAVRGLMQVDDHFHLFRLRDA
ncbi:MAG: putative sugar O-methyltransferase [Gammaproteobacteria bacterium]|nr:putative sugar O-methyltransferase [Gammaproteobacteria bacterium]